LKNLPKDLLLEMLTKLLLIREFESTYTDMYTRGEGVGISSQGVGQEAIPVGTFAALKKEDLIVGTHRGVGQFVARGLDLGRIFAELMGRSTGYCKGKGGKLHLAAADMGFLMVPAVVGAGIPVAVGAALAAKKRKTDQVVISLFGDGASNMGFFHESLNFASLHKLPVVFVCENNCYAQSMPVWKSTSVKDIADRAASYSLPGVVCDGNDVIAVYETARQAIDAARAGKGPTLIENKTYRAAGHHQGDPGRGTKYRTKEEMAEWDKKDPILRFKKELLEAKIFKEADIEQVQLKAKKAVEEAIKFAKESPHPDPSQLFTEVFAD
jgi:TPP-dependent pyruvate/acetoin dehydrogenase alpha subunit